MNLFDQRNLGYVNGVTDFDLFVSGNPTGGAYWVSDVFVATGSIVFDLGSSWPLSGVAIWQGSHFYSQDIQEYKLYVSDDINFTSGATLVGDFFPAIEPTSPSVNIFSLHTGRYVKWEIVSNFGNGFGTHGFEIALAAAIPEPSAVGIWCAVASLLVVAYRRRPCRG